MLMPPLCAAECEHSYTYIYYFSRDASEALDDAGLFELSLRFQRHFRFSVLGIYYTSLCGISATGDFRVPHSCRPVMSLYHRYSTSR